MEEAAAVGKENATKRKQIAIDPHSSTVANLPRDSEKNAVLPRRSLRPTIRTKRYCSCGDSRQVVVAENAPSFSPILMCNHQIKKKTKITSLQNQSNANLHLSKRRIIKKEHGDDDDKVLSPNGIHISQLGVDCILHLFQFLPLPTLLNLRRVCKQWNQLLNHQHLWKLVSFEQAHVVDWYKARWTINQYQTMELDFRGLMYNDAPQQPSWSVILGELKKMKHVINIHFGEVPSSVLLRLPQCMPQLRVVTASCIVETMMIDRSDYVELDVGKLSLLRNLQRLQLRAKLSMRLPAFSFCGGLQALVCLTALNRLSLTSMVQVMQEEWSFLEHMGALEELQLGECSNWNSKIYDMLGNLKNLKYLRLENGGSFNDSDTCFTANLAKLNRLQRLELIMFDIPHGMSATLFQLTKLKKFTVWPYCPDSSEDLATLNENTFKAVIAQRHLLHFSWGILVRMSYESAMASQRSSCPIPWFTCICQSPAISTTCICCHQTSVDEVTVMLKKELPSTYIEVFQVPMITSEITQVSG